MPDKYSLWIVPKGEPGQRLQELIDALAAEQDAPVFVPHLTLVADIRAESGGLAAMQQKVGKLARQIKPFSITLHGYGYLEEEFRCLFLLAQSIGLAGAYRMAAQVFPQVDSEHFKKMPHASVLYGNYSEQTKQQIIARHPFDPASFAVSSLELYRTNDPISSWELVASVPLG